MKRILSVILVLIMVLSLCACGESKEPVGLEVGFGRCMIVPDYEVQLAGGAATRVSEGAQDNQYITCIALRQGGETYIVGTMDFICAEDLFVDPAKALMSEVTGVPEENIMLNATHTHAGAAIRSNGSKNVDRYRTDFFGWAERAAKDAVADLSPAEVSYGSTTTTGMAFVRHYKMSDGSYAGPNYGDFSLGIVGHSNEADTELQLIQFTRPAENKKDIVLMNFPAHATMTQNSLSLSADFPGPTREYIETTADVLCAYFIAAAGDQVPSSRIEGESFSTDYQIYGHELGRIAVEEVMPNLTKIENTAFGYSHRTYTGKSMKEGIDRLAEAMAVQAEWGTVGRGTTEGKNAAKKHGFSSVYEVSAVINRSKYEEFDSMELKTLALGDIGIIFAPFEMFGSDGKYIKENSPYPMTFVITCAEGAEGYLPSELGFEMQCYEYHVTRFERGTAKKVADEFVSMLTEMKTPQPE